MATLVILSEIGVNIAPLLAGAGVVGLAVGFGAQSLVKDVITGAFCCSRTPSISATWSRSAARAGWWKA